MKIPRSVTNLLENKYVLYFVLFLAVSNMLGYIMMGRMTPVVAFVLFAYIVSRFSKNMTIIMAIPLFLVSLLMVGNHVKEGLAVREGLPDGGKDKDKDKDKVKVSPTSTSTSTSTSTIPVITPEPFTTEEVTGVENKGPKAGMTTMYKKNNRIDYAATVEDAYDDLNKILGGDGIKRLTSDTQKLMGQQMQLADAMKSMTPLLGQAKELLKGFDLKNLGDITSMAKSFGVSK